jgi:hypothetical protein
MRKVLLLVGFSAAILAALLAGCAHRDLKAPCAREDGLFGWLVASAYADSGCGPMRDVNGRPAP